MISAHLKKLKRHIELSREEEQAIRDSVAETRSVPADKILIRNGVELSSSMLLLDGWLARSKDMPAGERQVTQLHVAGDFADLHSFTLKRLDHDVATLSECVVAVVPHSRLKELTEQFPRLARLYWFSTNVDAAVHREWEVSLGRRTALSRIATLFCEIKIRLEIVGLTDGLSYDFDLTQTDLAECVGLTPIHVNRTLKELRERGLVQFKSGRVTIHDWDGLARVAEFDPAYLYLEKWRT